MLFVIIGLIAAGLALIVVEVVFIPGTTVVGILGFVFTIVGISYTYSTYGGTIGTYVLVGTTAVSVLTLYLSLRKGAWKRMSLNTAIKSKVNEGLFAELKIGEEGKALSALRPIGKVEFGTKVFEVSTLGDYIATGTRVRIAQLSPSQIIVEPIS